MKQENSVRYLNFDAYNAAASGGHAAVINCIEEAVKNARDNNDEASALALQTFLDVTREEVSSGRLYERGALKNAHGEIPQALGIASAITREWLIGKIARNELSSLFRSNVEPKDFDIQDTVELHMMAGVKILEAMPQSMRNEMADIQRALLAEAKM